MHAVVWMVSKVRYAIATRHIVEVVSTVAPRPMAHATKWVRGLMDYRGELIPLLDAATLLGQGECRTAMSSRILIVRAGEGEDGEKKIGLLIEQIFGVEHLNFSDASAHPGLGLPIGEYLGPVAQTDAGMVQLVDPAKVLTPEQKAVLFDRARMSAS